jgi:archaetidylinositol phosphate synthase
MQKGQSLRFHEAKRIQESFLAQVEKRTLLWLAERTPSRINSDHLTLLGLLAMAGAGAGYWWSQSNRTGLFLVIFCLALNWLGDSLDGTLARFRKHSRPRYGFYVDHVVDAFGALFLLGGLALSGYMSPWIAVGLLIAYLMLSIEVYLASYTLGDFKISYFRMGPTELRLLLCAGNAALFWKPTAHIMGHAFRLFDVGGTIGICGMMAILLVSAVRNTVRLYLGEPLPVHSGTSGRQGGDADSQVKMARSATNDCKSDRAQSWLQELTGRSSDARQG